MARGWESKSIEEQQSQATETFTHQKPRLTPNQLAQKNMRQGLLLNRTRILQQLASAQNPKHRSMLEDALSEIDHRIAQLG